VYLFDVFEASFFYYNDVQNSYRRRRRP